MTLEERVKALETMLCGSGWNLINGGASENFSPSLMAQKAMIADMQCANAHSSEHAMTLGIIREGDVKQPSDTPVVEITSVFSTDECDICSSAQAIIDAVASAIKGGSHFQNRLTQSPSVEQRIDVLEKEVSEINKSLTSLREVFRIQFDVMNANFSELSRTVQFNLQRVFDKPL